MSKRNQMPGLRLKGGIWHTEKRCKHCPGGWLRESTGTPRRTDAEAYLIRRLAELAQDAERDVEGVHLFEAGAMRYLEEIAHKPSAKTVAMHLDQVLPFIGHLTLEAVHDDTLRPFLEHELNRGLSPKSINNAITVVATVLNRAARSWRDGQHRPWLKHAPPQLRRLPTKGAELKAHPLSWAQQDRLFARLHEELRQACLFAVNTGCREQEVCQLQWSWLVDYPALGAQVFVLPESLTKNGEERVVVLNSVATRVVESQCGKHDTHVFAYRGRPLAKLHTSAWKRAWADVGLPRKGVRKGVHNLRHTFAYRLRAAGVPNETRKVLLGHTNGDITTHYSAATLKELLEAVEKAAQGTDETPILRVVGKVSEMKKGLTAE
jgi:integrase